MYGFSEFSVYAENPIEEEDVVAERLEMQGKKILKLNRGDPAVYFPTMKYMIDAYVKALREGKTRYSDFAGIRPLREAVAARYRRLYGTNVDAEDIVITNGVSEALMFINSVLINKGDKAVFFRPYYPLYIPDLKINGGNPIIERYSEERNWEVDTDSLERSIRKDLKAKKRLKYLVITNPNNPTGTVLEPNALRELVEIAKNHDMVLISDEIYDEITFNGAKYTSVSKLAEGIPHIILNGASKDFDATGFRIGFTIIPGKDNVSKELRRRIAEYAKLRLCVNTPAQYAVAEGISNVSEHNKGIRKLVAEIERRINFAAKRINESQYMSVVQPRGAYYLFPRLDMKAMKFKDDREFVDKLLKEKDVQLTRGSGFGEPGHIRIVGLPPKDILETALNRIEDFCKAHSR
ncbi:MAG: aminotransferase class I/II-fold pyridoxal phosphate-dependent enzyme [Candidatus Micrarchaeota archaeon]|nr:aminotransferase class I/II-fold pyridoxal phosphate-dependent enzyme [Candidatus Micrarchaeota archaeon]